MDVPTTYGFTAVAGQSKTFPIEGTNVYGVDIGGTLSPIVFQIDTNTYIVTTATRTDAQLTAAMQEFCKRYGGFHAGAGGERAQATKQIAPALTTTS